MRIETSITLAERALQDARTAITEGRLADARRHLRLAANESDDAAHSLNARIALDKPTDAYATIGASSTKLQQPKEQQ